MHADKWGPFGSILAALCCLGAAPLLAALSAVGLGFLINDLILIPLLTFFLGAALWGLHRDRRRHERAGPMSAAWGGAGLTLGGLWISPVVVGGGLVLLTGSSLWNFLLIRGLKKQRTSATCD